MFDLVHQMRTRIITSPSFDGNPDHRGHPVRGHHGPCHRGPSDCRLPVERQNIVPILKVDKGLEAEQDGAQVMKPIPGLDALLSLHAPRASSAPDALRHQDPGAGLDRVIDQQFQIARQILDAGLVPIIEPEVDIHSRTRPGPKQLRSAIIDHLAALGNDQQVMLKLTLPETNDLYLDLVDDAG